MHEQVIMKPTLKAARKFLKSEWLGEGKGGHKKE
jgi:hypothetical protein